MVYLKGRGRTLLRNIINVEKLDQMLEDFWRRYGEEKNPHIPLEKLQAFIFGNIRNYGLRKAKVHNDLFFRFRHKSFEEREIASKSSGPFHLIDLQDFFFRVQSVLDFVCYSGYATVKHLTTLDFEVAEKKHERWLKTIRRKEKAIEGKVETVFTFPSGDFVVQLLDKTAYEREGFLLNHCVGSYYGTSKSTIYSLRNVHNKPLATLEVREGVIHQVRMYSNGRLLEAYKPLVNAFAKHKNFKFQKLVDNAPNIKIAYGALGFILFGFTFLALRIYMSHAVELPSYFSYVLGTVMFGWLISGLVLLGSVASGSVGSMKETVVDEI